MTKNTKPYAVSSQREIDLSLSINPLGCSPRVKKLLSQNTENSLISPNFYPQVSGQSLRESLANIFGWNAGNIFVTNGSENILFNIPRIFSKQGEKVILPCLTFPLIGKYCRLANLSLIEVSMDNQLGIDLQKMANAVRTNPKAKIVFLCNPNNPTGMVTQKAELIKFLDKIPINMLIVIDEANIDFGGESVIDQAVVRPNVLVLRTFSKGYGLAGSRVGFAVGDTKLISALRDNTQPFPISSLSEQLSVSALDDQEFIQESEAYLSTQRTILIQGLQELNCVVFPSEANNIFCKLPAEVDVELFWRKLEERDVSIIRGSYFPGFSDQFFRISPRTKATNRQFLAILREVLS